MEINTAKNIISIAARLGNIAGKSLDDGKISLADIVLLPSLAMVFVDLIKIEWKKFLPELKTLTDVQQADLISHFKTEFNIPQKSIEVSIESVLSVVVQLSHTIMSLIHLYKKP